MTDERGRNYIELMARRSAMSYSVQAMHELGISTLVHRLHRERRRSIRIIKLFPSIMAVRYDHIYETQLMTCVIAVVAWSEIIEEHRANWINRQPVEVDREHGLPVNPAGPVRLK